MYGIEHRNHPTEGFFLRVFLLETHAPRLQWILLEKPSDQPVTGKTVLCKLKILRQLNVKVSETWLHASKARVSSLRSCGGMILPH